ncbi:hypothetical protein KESI111651_01490 [Kerstersia similis]
MSIHLIISIFLALLNALITGIAPGIFSLSMS